MYESRWEVGVDGPVGEYFSQKQCRMCLIHDTFIVPKTTVDTNHFDEMMEQATRLTEYENIIRWHQSQEELDNTKQLNRELTTAERIAKRQALVDEYFSNNYMIDINFFRRWGGGMVPVTIKKIWDWYNPFQQGSVEIMSRENREFTRGHAVEMDADLIISTQFYFYQEVENGIEIFSHGMNEPRLLKW